MSTPVRVAIVNDYEIVVAGIAAVLARHDDRIRVVELDSREPVVSDVDVVLYDSYGQVQGDAIEIDDIMDGSRAKLLVLSWNTDPELVKRALAAGASGYVSKGSTVEELVEAIERTHAGEQVTPGPEGDELGRWPGDQLGLSARESEVLALICQGLSNQDIAERAFIGINTVKTYIRTLYRKIGAGSRTQAVLWGMEHGFSPDRTRVVVDGER
ncbi:response regulator transcription factor [Nocardioides litoris]|uniref:LuxR C-terminal-related transcriptional regulator n=1 Tax=Nocardioides litoris TaxID=1926648 RepID=UPI0011228A29|nr:response regulator transcription factor [Nocardioides litoris]